MTAEPAAAVALRSHAGVLLVPRRLQETWRRLRALERAVDQDSEASEDGQETEETQ